MSEWSWRQAVAEQILAVVNRRSSPAFSLRDVYGSTDQLSILFPRNRNVKAKIRQTLQYLRNDGFLEFAGSGRYVVNVAFDGIIGDPNILEGRGFESPSTRRVLRNLRLRDTFLAAEIKRRYSHICQVCRAPLRLSSSIAYAEGHHLRPLGAPHHGPDVAGNILVLCPNHHVMFDRGALSVIPTGMRIVHVVENEIPKGSRLYVLRWHKLNPRYLAYHHDRIYRG